MAARLWSLSTSIAGWHGDERTVGSPLNDAELIALRRTRLFGATGTVLMAIGALGVGARPVVQDPTFGVRLLNLPSRIQTVSLTMTTTGAVMMTLAWLMLGRFALGERRMTRSQLDRTLLLWVLPLLIAPPMYSRDVYSYLAQSEIAINGLDPYKVGPATGLGLDHVFTLSVPTMWRETPAPYGPLFLWIGQGHFGADGREHRLRGAVPPAGGAARCRPHRVGGAAAGAPLRRRRGQRAVAGGGQPAADHASGGGHPQRGADARADARGHGVRAARCVRRQPAAAETVGLAAISRRMGPLATDGDADARRRADHAVLTGQAAGAAGRGLRRDGPGVSLGRHLQGLRHRGRIADRGIGGGDGGDRLGQRAGFGWLFTLGTANVVRSWMSLPTLLALGTGQVGILLGLGDHTTAVLGLTRGIGVFIIAILVTWLLLAVLRGRLHPVGGLGVALGMTVLLFPVVQPWYVLWAVIPLAAWATRRSFRTTAIVVTLVVGIFGPTANGDRFTVFQILLATAASTVIVAGC